MSHRVGTAFFCHHPITLFRVCSIFNNQFGKFSRRVSLSPQIGLDIPSWHYYNILFISLSFAVTFHIWVFMPDRPTTISQRKRVCLIFASLLFSSRTGLTKQAWDDKSKRTNQVEAIRTEYREKAWKNIWR